MSWFVFNKQSGTTMEGHLTNPETGQVVEGTLEFMTAADAALWSARFMEMTEELTELDIVNTELGITIRMTKLKTELPNANNDSNSEGA